MTRGNNAVDAARDLWRSRIRAVTRGLAKLAAERGAPNRFTIADVAAAAGLPSPATRRVGTHYESELPTNVTYSRGVFAVTSDPAQIDLIAMNDRRAGGAT